MASVVSKLQKVISRYGAHFYFSEPVSLSYITTDGQSASLSWNKAPICGLRPDFYYCGFVDVGRSLWREDRSVVYNCCWPSPEHSFSGPSVMGLVTIFYCFRFDTSLSVASYDSRGYGGGIRVGNGLTPSDELRLFSHLLPSNGRPSTVDMEIVCCHRNVFVSIRCRGNRH
jgi:hypothetical protein